LVDLADTHQNVSDGVHVASAAGGWGAVVHGFAGMRDEDGNITFDPRLPVGWAGVTFALTVRGSRVRVTVRQDELRLTLETGDVVDVAVRGETVTVRQGAPVVVPLDGHGPRLAGEPPPTALAGLRRPDGSVVTPSVPHFSGPNG